MMDYNLSRGPRAKDGSAQPLHRTSSSAPGGAGAPLHRKPESTTDVRAMICLVPQCWDKFCGNTFQFLLDEGEGYDRGSFYSDVVGCGWTPVT